MALNKVLGTFEPDNLFAANQELPAVADVLEIAASQDLKRGSLVNVDGEQIAATTDGGVSAGEFVHFVSGASLKPTRCYLEYSKNGVSKSTPVLPEKIIVVFPDETSSVVEPGNPDDTGEITTPTAEITHNSGINVWSADGSVIIEAQPDMDYTIVDLSGRTLKNGVTHSTRETVTLSRRAAGIVIVKIGTQTFKVQY